MDEDESNWESEWEEESGRRVRELEEGSVTTIPWSEVREKVRARLNAKRQS